MSPFCDHRSTACTSRGCGSFGTVELTPADTSLASSAIYLDFSSYGLLFVVADAAVCLVKGHVAAWLVLVPAAYVLSPRISCFEWTPHLESIPISRNLQFWFRV